LTCAISARYAERHTDSQVISTPSGASWLHVTITLNGERFELEQPMSVSALLARLEIDPRRVAVEHNLDIVKRHAYADVVIGDGDAVEIVNFVGGG
jgi:thiamine biosynthesis protein ThiS